MSLIQQGFDVREILLLILLVVVVALGASSTFILDSLFVFSSQLVDVRERYSRAFR